MNYIQQAPFFRLLLAVITGILLFEFTNIPVYILLSCIILSCILLIIPLFTKNSTSEYKLRWIFGFGIFLLFITSSYILTGEINKKNKFNHISEKGIFFVELISSPAEKQNSYLYKIKTISFSDSVQTYPSAGNAYLYLQKDSLSQSLSPGDRLLVEATFNPPPGIKNPDGFDYAAYLKRQGISATAYASSGSWIKTDINRKFSIMQAANECQKYLLNIYKNYGFDNNELAVLSALTLGYTDGLEPELRKCYSASGTMHILAVSGLHVGIIYAVIAFILGFLNKSLRQRQLKTILIIAFLWIYAFITGLSPSVFRASLMFSLVALANLFDRKSQIYNTICMSAFIMLLVNPNLLFNVGFQLSYSAVLSIIYFQPKISGIFQPRSKVVKWLWDFTAVSLAAQLGTLPFTLFYFQTFPNYFIFANIIAIPAATLILYHAFFLIVVSFIPYLSDLIAFILKYILKTLNFSVDFIQSLPYSTSQISINSAQVFLIFLTLFLFIFYFYLKRYSFLAGTFSTILIFFFINGYIKYNTLNSNKIVVYNGYRHTHVNLTEGDNNYIITTDSTEMQQIASSFWNNKKLKKPISVQSRNMYFDGFVFFRDKKILILEEDFSRKQLTNNPIEVDYLIIGNSLKPRVEQLLECINPSMIITDQSITPWYTEQIRKKCEERNISFHSTNSDGAFIVELKQEKNTVL